jgi:hypothetical protein
VPEPLQPDGLFAALSDAGVDYVLIGGLAAVLHGSSAMTNDADIVPSAEPRNLECLSVALRDLDARIRSDRDPEGLAFDPHPDLLAGMAMLNTTTRCGDLDLTFRPSGTDGYDDLVQRAESMNLGGLEVRVAALRDIIASKEAADRPKDRAVLPILYALEDEIRRG